jgi:MoaA/NifB/PqqE/SkfB family radical SAM enzyme
MSHVLPREVPERVRERAATLPYRPFNCVWELTLACNLRCAHCGSRAGRPRERELDTAECLDLVDQLAALSCDLVTLSGGEPMLRPDWDLIARAAADRGIFVNMVTNGTLMTREAAQRAKDAGMCNVGVSIDGPEALHEEIRGRGTFRKTLGAIAHLRAVGLSVGVLTHVNRANLDRLDEVKAVAMAAGAQSWRLQLGKPMGSMHDRDDLVIAPRDVLRLVPAIARMQAEGGIDVRVGDSIGYYGPHDKALRGRGWRGGRKESWQGCQAGMQAIGIESDGGIKGCLSMQAKDGDRDPFREGSVRSASLAELWFREGAFAYNREFTTASLTGHCRRCGKAAVCRGGARCVAAAATGALSEDPYCFMRVSTMQADTGLRAVLARGAAAAGAAIVLSAAGCDVSQSPSGNPDTVQACEAGYVPCGDGCCMPEYGYSGPDPDLDVVEPGPSDVPAEASADAIDCSQVCCLCDYGIIPEEVYQACCVKPPDPAPDASEPVVDVPQPEATPADVAQPDTVPPDAAPPDAAQPDAIDCSQVCCMCEYGIIPEEVYQACCANPWTPDRCQKEACCNCKDPAPTAEIVKACCGTCDDPGWNCCGCDYGMLPDPPAQCCRDKWPL